eukprot:jgi/Botrbrau1/14144/Bobra.182_3s0085.1
MSLAVTMREWLDPSNLATVGDAVMDLWTRLSRPPPGAEFGSHPFTILVAVAVCAGSLLVLQTTGLLLPRKAKLKFADQLEWNLRIVSTLHAITLVIGAYLCFMDSLRYKRREDIVHGYSWPPDFFARIFIGYLIYDLVFMLIFHPVLKDNTGILHHLIFIPVTAYVLAHSIMKFPFVWLSFCEVSTPLLNLRWRLAVLDMKDSVAYMVNGLSMAFLFFVARVVLYGLGLAHLFRNSDLWRGPEHPVGYQVVVYLFAAGYALQVYWMYVILKGVVRLAWRGRAKKVA